MNKAEHALGLVHQIRFWWLSGQWPSPPPNVRQPCGCCHIPKDAVSVPKSAVDKRLEPIQKQTVFGDQKARLHLYLRQTAADQAASARLFRFFLSKPRYEFVRAVSTTRQVVRALGFGDGIHILRLGHWCDDSRHLVLRR